MKIWSVHHYFVEGAWSFYPGETFSEEAFVERGIGEDAVLRRTNAGYLVEQEVEDAPSRDQPPHMNVMLEFTQPPEPAPEESES